MKIQPQSIYAGPNIYLPVRAVRWTFESEAEQSWRSRTSAVEFLSPLFAQLPGLHARLQESLADEGAEASAPGGDGPSLAELTKQVAMELQRLTGHAGRQAAVVPLDGKGNFHIICEYKEVPICLRSMEAASVLVTVLIASGKQREQALARVLEVFYDRIERQALDQTTRALVQAAEARGLPWFRLGKEFRTVQLGYGRHYRRLFESMPDSEGHISSRFIAPNKAVTNKLLKEIGLPVPDQLVARDAAQAARAADSLGYPVVLKPLDQSKGRGVTVGLRDAQAVLRACRESLRPGSRIIVEKFLPGEDHRMLVVGGRLIAVAQRIPGSVVGDGRQTVRQLVDQTNRDPRRGRGFIKVLVALALDETALRILRQQGLDATSVPAPGRRVFLRRTANISTGGTALDVTDRVHPDNRRMAELAAQSVGLQVAGIDFITPDIGRSHRKVGGICEVNIFPGLRPHWVAEGGEDRDVVGPILDLMYPPGQSHHVPLAAVTGTNGKTTTSHMLAHILRQAGRHVGLVTTLGTAIDGERIATGDLAGPGGFNMVARNPNTDTIVAEVARGALINRGLGFRSCDVGAVLNVTTDHLGQYGIETLDDMAEVKRVVARAVTGTLVLNADDPRCLAMTEGATARQVCLVTLEDACPALTAHLATGGLGARLTRRDGRETLTLCSAGEEIALLSVADMPAAFGGLARHNLQNGLFAAALARGMGIGADDIGKALASFHCNRESLPGRLNVFDGHPFKVILDYGHNPGGYRMVGPMVTAMAAGKGRRICVFTSPADRGDAHLAEIADVAAPYFDIFVCRQGLRQNRDPGEVPDKLRAALIAKGVPADQIFIGRDPQAAVLAGLEMARPGDIVYVMSTPNPEGGFWQLIENFGKDRGGRGTET